MRIFSNYLRHTLILSLALTLGMGCVQAQATRDAQGSYSDSGVTTRSRTTRAENSPTNILRTARTVYINPNEYIDTEYLEYKLDKLPEFGQWKLAFVRNVEKADLVIEIHRKALNYIFSIVDPASGIIVTKGKVVAINGLVAAEDISKEIVRKMKSTRALPTTEPE
ncbi:MAG: hypothetical protein QOH63_3905 [Acidobacteriota bacterium]|nr:hypothetical protein [Acidobacteriota bacterium]